MKTTENHWESMDDILFEGRNKLYGAYEIRKKYEKYLALGFCISIFLMCAGISAPLIASYYQHHYIKPPGEEIKVVLDGMSRPPADEPIPPPPDDNNIEKQSRFLKPVISIDSVTDDNFGRQDILNAQTTFQPVDTAIFTLDTATARKKEIEEPGKKQFFLIVEEMPYFPGGEEARLRFLHDNIRYPETAKSLGIYGTVFVEFIVNETGDGDDVVIRKGIGGGCDEEAARVVKLMKYIPGRQGGRAVSVKFTFPIKFMFQN